MAKSPVSAHDLERLKARTGFGKEDERSLLLAERVLADQTKQIVEHWSGRIVASEIEHFCIKSVAGLFVVLLTSALIHAQTTLTAFLPEVESNFRLSSNVRLVFQAKGYMEDGDLNHAQLGPSLQFNLRPFEHLKEITHFDLDDMKCTPVVFTIGYRFLPSTVQPGINRLQPIVLFHIPFPGRALLSDRNRADLDWANGVFNWTYRNRFTAERRLTIRSYHPGPYVAAEFSYQSQYSKWSVTHLFAGCLFPLTRHIQFDGYYEHVNNTGPDPNHQVNAIGAMFSFYSRRKRIK